MVQNGDWREISVSLADAGVMDLLCDRQNSNGDRHRRQGRFSHSVFFLEMLESHGHGNQAETYRARHVRQPLRC